MRKIILTISVLLISSFAVAKTQDIYSFKNENQKLQFQYLIKQLRCLVCQNEDLADSNAGLAKDLRNEVYQLVKSGRSNQQIKSYLTNRYGNFILFKPPLIESTYLLWFGPFIFLVLAFLIALALIYKRKQTHTHYLNDDEKKQLDKFIDTHLK